MRCSRPAPPCSRPPAPWRGAEDVDRAARDVIRRHGFGDDAFPHGTGHGVGFAAIDHTARPRLHPASDDVLQPGMVFNVEPAIYIEGYGGFRHCDMVVVTPGERGGADAVPDGRRAATRGRRRPSAAMTRDHGRAGGIGSRR